ncbi:MAG: glycosyltransferase [Lachnospiraceae bacterium]|nr:glycosyltransferase [Lachnospiraceae bacterium]
MKSKKITFYFSSMAKGGSQRVIVNLAESLLNKGHQVTIVTTMIAENEYELPKGVKRILSDISEEEITSNRLLNLKKRFCKLRNIWKEEQPDIIISFIGKNNFMAILTAWGLKIPVVVSVRAEPTVEYYNSFMRFCAKHLLCKADGIVLQTEDSKAFFNKKTLKKAVVLPNPLNPNFIGDYYEGIRENKIVAVGRIDSLKNQKLIVESFFKIAAELADVELVLYGDGEDRESLMELAKRSPYADRISFPGSVNNVKEHIKRAKLFVLSSNAEGMPNALMEALALGIPCVSTNCPCGGPKMLMEGKENGILVPVGDSEEMAKAMKTILQDEELWEKYSKNAYDITKDLNPTVVNKKWQEYLYSIMDK